MDTAPALPPPAPRRRRFASPAVAAAILAITWSSSAAAEPPQGTGSLKAAPPAEEAAGPRSLDSIAPVADNGSLQRTIAVVTGSVGFAGIATGSVFGGLAIVRWNQVKASLGSCSDKANYNGCPEKLKDVQLEASAFATVSTYGIIAGTAAIAGAIAVWYTSPRLPQKARPKARLTFAPKARITFAPVVSPEGAAGVVMGVF